MQDQLALTRQVRVYLTATPQGYLILVIANSRIPDGAASFSSLYQLTPGSRYPVTEVSKPVSCFHKQQYFLVNG